MSWIGVRAAAAAGGGPMVAIAFVNAVMALVNASVWSGAAMVGDWGESGRRGS